MTFTLHTPPDSPARLVLTGAGFFAPGGHPLVDLFTAGERRARSGRGYVRSAVGERLRPVQSSDLEVTQADPVTGLTVISRVIPRGDCAIEIGNTVRNDGPDPVVLTAVTSAGFRVVPDAAHVSWAESGWLTEHRWRTEPLRDHLPDADLPLHGQDGRGRWQVTGHGAWSTSEYLPVGVLSAGGHAVGWEILTTSPWLWECGEGLDDAYVALLGPAEAEHGFAHLLEPGASFAAAPALIAWSDRGLDGVAGALTTARRERRRARLGGLPVVYNDFLNTLMADPSTAKLEPLIDAAAVAGAEVFCIDAGWFADDAGWWDSVGEWAEAPGRFTGGLQALIERIRERGMTPGLWLEPEVIGVASPAVPGLPDEAYFQRLGSRIVEHGRYHLDFRHPAVRARLDAVVDRLVTRFGLGFLKLDYNIDPGSGTDHDAISPAAGLLEHARAYRNWLGAVVERHPGLLIETCASGGMRADGGLLEVSSLQSTSDQQDYRRYATIAVAAPMSIPPEQAGNWACPAASMSEPEVAYAMLGGIVGRLYLTGFLHDLNDRARALVVEAVAVHRAWRASIAQALPSWPVGLPAWTDSAIALRLDTPGGTLLAVWSRDHDGDLDLPGVTAFEQIYPAEAPPWPRSGSRLRLPAGHDARLFVIR